MKRHNLTLIIILIILIAVAYFIMEKPGERFTKEPKSFISLDSANIDKILVNNQFGEVQTERKPGGWVITKPLDYPASPFKINSVLMQLTEVELISEATHKKERFAVYGIDSHSVQLQIYSKGKLQAHLIIGNNADNPMETFVKRFDEDIVYLVKGPLSYIFNVPLRDWRLRTIIDLTNNNPQEIIFRDKKESFTLSFTDSLWKINNTIIDNDLVSDYIRKLSPLETDFFEDEQVQLPDMTFNIMIDKSININLYIIDEDRYYLTTNQNPQIFILLKSKAQSLIRTKNDFLQ